MSFLNKAGLEHLWSNILLKLNSKVDKVEGKGLSTNDYTAADKEKLAGIESYINEQINSASIARIAEVELLSSNWVGENSPYYQVVNIEGVTEFSQVDLTPSIEQLVIFYEKDLGFVTENEDGVVTVYAIGQKPENDYTIQVTITEVGA